MLAKNDRIKNLVINKIISNVSNQYWKYYLVFLFTCISTAVVDYGIYCYLYNSFKEKELAFVEGAQLGIYNVVKKDLQLIFDQSKDLAQLSILKNFLQAASLNEREGIVGNIIYIKRNEAIILVDLQPIISLINDTLESDFYYQISLNNNILATNVENTNFIYQNNYKINEDTLLIIKLLSKVDSNHIKNYNNYFKKQVFTVFLVSGVILIFLILIALYITRKREKYLELNYKLLILGKAYETNINYIKECQTIEQYEVLPITLPVVETGKDIIDISNLVEELKVHSLAYTIHFYYKFNLHIESAIANINITCSKIIFNQIIISLFYNILYFMRGGSHIKNIEIKITEESIIFIYDSFAANEDHMEKWSYDLFQHLGNPYILDCKKIFELIKNCGLTYKIIPQQGKNEVIIYLNRKKTKADVIKFNKNA